MRYFATYSTNDPPKRASKRWPGDAENYRLDALSEARAQQRELSNLAKWLTKNKLFRALAIVDSTIHRAKNIEIAMLRAKLGVPYEEDSFEEGEDG